MIAELEFLAEHGAHLRQTLVMLEGEDGAFRLIGHAVVTAGNGMSRLIAAVSSTNTDANTCSSTTRIEAIALSPGIALRKWN